MATHEYVPRIADEDPNHAPPMMDLDILRATRSQYKANKVRKQEKVSKNMSIHICDLSCHKENSFQCASLSSLLVFMCAVVRLVSSECARLSR